MSIYQADRVKDIPFSGIRSIVDKAARLEEQGKHIIRLEIGRPNFDTPENIKNAAKKALDESKVFYTSNYGIMELRCSIAEKLKKENGVSYEPDEIIATSGVSEGVFISLFSFLNPGDEILIPDPAWLNYLIIPKMMGARHVFYHLREENDFQVDIEEIKSLITSKTKMILLNTPNNPTGGVLQLDTLKKIADIAIQNDIMVVSDEIYDKIIFDGERHYSIAALPGMKERTIILNGFSKTYSMTGWRLGYIAASKENIAVMVKVHQYNVTSAASFCQWAGVEALVNGDDAVESMVGEYERRRAFIVSAINSIDGLSCKPPKGSFYLFINIKQLGVSPTAFVEHLLRFGVSLVPGTVFGEGGDGYVRLSFAASYEDLEEAAQRIKKAVDSLRE